MAIAKWFPNLTPTTSSRAAARTVLAARVEGVDHYLKFVKHRPGRDPEHVHQLRVATRRLAAAVSIFKSCLDRRTHRHVRRAARKLRRASGAVRDLDVQQSLLDRRFEAAGRVPPIVVKLCGQELARQRRTLERDLKLAIHRWGDRFRHAAQESLTYLEKRNLKSNPRAAKFVMVARTTLRKRVKQLLATGTRDLHDFDNLHQLRIAAKRLRYAMEVFAGCYPREFQHELYLEVERLQEDLGDINDLWNLKNSLSQLVEAIRSRCRHNAGTEIVAPLLDVAAEVDRDSNQRKSRFLQSWTVDKQTRFCKCFENLLQSTAPRVAHRARRRRR
jgi:CHAD domain-containing protein